MWYGWEVEVPTHILKQLSHNKLFKEIKIGITNLFLSELKSNNFILQINLHTFQVFASTFIMV